MRTRRTHFTTRTLGLPGGTEDNDLWIYDILDDSKRHVIASVWEPTDEEREKIASGKWNIRLLVWAVNGTQQPVAIDITDEPLGKAPDA
jgi:hypothetical protein